LQPTPHMSTAYLCGSHLTPQGTNKTDVSRARGKAEVKYLPKYCVIRLCPMLMQTSRRKHVKTMTMMRALKHWPSRSGKSLKLHEADQCLILA